MSIDDFVSLHTHSDMSQLDGCGKINEYVKTAKARGHKAIAFTDHGTMRGLMTLYEQCKEVDIKPIFGTEFYVAKNMRRKGLTEDEKAEITKGISKAGHKAAIKAYEEREGIRDRWHITVWAKNNEGLRNLYKLSSASFIDGFYYKPRIDIDALIEHGAGLHVASGCLSSPINDHWLAGKKRDTFAYADRLHEAFKDRFWLELQPHAIREQRETNALMLKLHERYGGVSKFIATQDAHYVHQEDAPHHEVLLCIGTGSNLSDPSRFKFDGDEFHFRTRKEMWRAFKAHHEHIPGHVVKQALDATMELAESCDAKIEVDYHKTLLPDPGLPEKYAGNHFKYLTDLCLEGWAWREVPKRAGSFAARERITKEAALEVYRERLKMELRALKVQRFVPYFLIVRDLYRFARESSIMVGPGRGSVGGSLIAFLLGIASTDPIEHGLIFERFISPTRIDMPDIDMDFEDRRRGEIMEYIRQKYGADKVCQIATIGKLSGKECIRSVSRVLEIPLNEVNQVTKSIVERSSGDERASQTIEDSFKEFDVCREFDKKYPDVLKHARVLEGMAKNLGVHAAGVVASPVTLTDVIPLEIRKQAGKPDLVVSAFDMYGVAAAGLVKMDVLGLRTLTVIKEALEQVEIRHGKHIDMERVSLNDPKVLAAFTAHDYGGVFQYDTPSADKVCTGVDFSSFEDVAAMTALNRPGTSRSGLATKYVERKKNPKLVEKIDFHPAVSAITKDTLGIIVYQEHVLRIFTDIAGFAPATADKLRKTIAKKIGDETLGRERETFVKGAMEKTPGMTEAVANKIMDAITFFGCLDGDELIAGPQGSKRISDIKAGDKILSYKNGRLVKNRVKAAGPSGWKRLVRIRVGGTRSVLASRDHWWLMNDGLYRKTRALRLGDRIAISATECSPTLKFIRDEEELQERLRTQGVVEGALLSVLPEGIQEGEDSRGEAGRLRAQQAAGAPSGEVLEGRIGQDGFCRCRSSAGRIGPGEQELEGRLHSRLLGSGEVSAFGSEEVRALREEAGSDTSGAEHEDASRPPHESGQERQPQGEHRDDLPEVPLQGASSGEGIRWLEVTGLELDGVAETFDLECEGEPANYVLANGLISHNSYGFNKSHATAYGMIAYWCMWIKVYYPVEFFWSLMKNEPERIDVQKIAKDAKKHGIELMPPHASTSKAQFTIDGDKRIRGSLVDINGVGEKAAEAVMAAQPFKDMVDFVARVDRRRCNRGAVVALAKAGALDGLLPNIKWFIENADAAWDALTSKRKRDTPEKLREMLAASAEMEDYNEEDKLLVGSKVSPLAFGRHPIDAYESFINGKVKATITEMGDEDYWKNFDGKGHFIAGVIVEVKYNQIGDFHTGPMPSDQERREQFWGARYANVNIEERSGKQNRVKFDHDVFDANRHIIDKGLGTAVLAHVTASEFTQTLRAQFAIDIEDCRTRYRADAVRTQWEMIVMGTHPAKVYPWKDDTLRKARITNDRFWKSQNGGVFVGVVTNVRLKYDKKGGLMAYFGLIGGDLRFTEVTCFASMWLQIRAAIQPGKLIKIELARQPDTWRRKGLSTMFNGGQVKVLNRSPTFSAALGGAE